MLWALHTHHQDSVVVPVVGIILLWPSSWTSVYTMHFAQYILAWPCPVGSLDYAYQMPRVPWQRTSYWCLSNSWAKAFWKQSSRCRPVTKAVIFKLSNHRSFPSSKIWSRTEINGKEASKPASISTSIPFLFFMGPQRQPPWDTRWSTAWYFGLPLVLLAPTEALGPQLIEIESCVLFTESCEIYPILEIPCI